MCVCVCVLFAVRLIRTGRCSYVVSFMSRSSHDYRVLFAFPLDGGDGDDDNDDEDDDCKLAQRSVSMYKSCSREINIAGSNPDVRWDS